MKRKSIGKEPSLPPSQRCPAFFLSVFCALAVLVHLVASFFPKGRIWGINQWSYFSPGASLIAGIFVLLFFVPSLNQLLRKGLSCLASFILSYLRNIRGFGEKKKYLWYLTLSLPFFIPFWLLRDQTHFLGDGAQIISRTNSGKLSVNWAEPLEVFLHLKAFHLACAFGQMDSAKVYAILSCLAGVLFVFLLFLFADFWGKERKGTALIFLVLLSMGSTQLFFGYAEHYSFLYVFVFAFIFSSLAYLEGKTRWFFPVATFILASLSHVSALYLLPSLSFLLVVKDKNGRSSWIKKVLILGLSLAFVGLILAAYKNYSLILPSFFVPLSVDSYAAPGYFLFSLPHILDFLNQQSLISPVGLITLLASLVCMVGAFFFKDRAFQFLLLVSAFQLLFNFLVYPGLGASRDWDLFSAVGLGYTILGLFIFLRLFKDKAKFEYLSLILVLFSFYSTAPWIILNSNAQKSTSRFQNLLEIDVKRSANGYFFLIKYFEAHGMELQARKLEEKAKQTFPEIGLVDEASRLVKMGELERAEQMFLQAERFAPKLAQIHNNLGYLYVKQGELDKAEDRLKEGIRLCPFLSSPYGDLGHVYFLRREWDLALDAYKKAIRLKTDYPETYCNAATIYLIRGELNGAEAYYKKTLELNPEFLDAYVGLGDIYNRRALPSEAIKMYRAAVFLNPDLAKAHFRLGMTYLSINEKETAKEELELYLKISPYGKDAKEAQEILEQLRK